MKALPVIAALLFSASSVGAVSLEELQNTAVDNREVIKRYEVNLYKGIHDLSLARSGYRPSVDIAYTMNKLDEDSMSEQEENSLLYGVVTWNLFNGFATKYQIAAAEMMNEAYEYQLQGVKQDIRLNVALKYLNVYERQANLEVARKNYDTLLKIYKDSENRLDVGLIDRNELLKFKVDLDNSDITLESARAGLEKSVLLLGREIGADVQLESLDFKEFLQIPGKEDFATNQARMLTDRTDIQAMQKMIDAASYQVKLKKGSYYPQVNLIGSYANYDDHFINMAGDVNEDELRLKLQLSMNLYQGGAKKEAVSKARLELQGLKYDLNEMIDSYKAQLKILHIDYEVSLRNVTVAQASIEQAEENLRITRLKYDEGLQRESDLLDAITKLSRAQYNYVTVIRGLFLTKFTIARMVEAL